jgi:hypothetical protein
VEQEVRLLPCVSAAELPMTCICLVLQLLACMHLLEGPSECIC